MRYRYDAISHAISHLSRIQMFQDTAHYARARKALHHCNQCFILIRQGAGLPGLAPDATCALAGRLLGLWHWWCARGPGRGSSSTFRCRSCLRRCCRCWRLDGRSFILCIANCRRRIKALALSFRRQPPVTSLPQRAVHAQHSTV